MRTKKGISTIVANILLILIVVAAIISVSAFVIPWVNENLGEGKDCLDTRDQFSIDPSYTCYTSTGTQVMIQRGYELEIKGFAVSLLTDGARKRYDLINSTQVEGITMYGGDSLIILPEKGGAETYIFNMASNNVEIAPILENDKICSAVTAEIPKC